MRLTPVDVLQRLTDDVVTALGDGFLGLYAYGSVVTGDFAPERSDLDLLAVLRADPTASILDVLAPLHERVAEEHPEWAGRIEVEYLSVQALTDFRTFPRPMVRISPGEPLHLVAATRHHVLNWNTARLQGLPLRDPSRLRSSPRSPRPSSVMSSSSMRRTGRSGSRTCVALDRRRMRSSPFVGRYTQ